MASQTELIEQLKALNQIAETLNRQVDVRGALGEALSRLIELMGLETGWIFLRTPVSEDKWHGKGYTLIAHHNLPPALALDNSQAWHGGCDCQGFCNKGKLLKAYNEVECSRLEVVQGDRQGLAVHASAPLDTGREVVGILNVAAPTWEAFSPEALALLSNVGSLMAAALERAQLFDMLRDRRMDEQAALLTFSRKLLGQLDLREIMTFLIDEVRTLLGVDACALFLPGGQNAEQLHLKAASGWQEKPGTVAYDASNSLGAVMLTKVPMLIEDLESANTVAWGADWLPCDHYRGHAVVPLLAEDKSIGVLVINSLKPRNWGDDDVRFLSLMANQAAIAMEKARLHHEEVQRQRLEEELAIGQQIQLSLLPASCPEINGWQFAAFYCTSRQVGGDFYDCFELDSNQMGIVVADVAGKGVPAALYMALSRTIIRTVALNRHTPHVTLTRSNSILLRESTADLFLTACYAMLNTTTGRLLYGSAGHNPALWYRFATGTLQQLRSRGIVLGAFPDIPCEEREYQISDGDLIVFYTDGITEAMNLQRQEFGVERLQAVVNANAHHDAEYMVQAIIDAVQTFVGSMPQTDDMTLFIVKRDHPKGN